MVARVSNEPRYAGVRAVLEAAPKRLLRWSVAAAYLAEAACERLARPALRSPIRLSASLLAGLAALLGLGLAGGAAVASAAFAPSEGEAVAAVFAPWVDADDAAERVFRAGGLVIVEPHQGWPVYAASVNDDFMTRLRAQGAWMVFDADGVEALFGARR